MSAIWSDIWSCEIEKCLVCEEPFQSTQYTDKKQKQKFNMLCLSNVLLKDNLSTENKTLRTPNDNIRVCMRKYAFL